MPGQPMPERLPLDTLETRLVRIEGMLEEITERIIASNTEQRAIRDLIEEMKERQ